MGDDEIFPVCSPSFLTAHPEAGDIGDPARRSLRSTCTRIVDSAAEDDRSGCSWRDWSAGAGVHWEVDAPTVVLSHAHLALQAAAEGIGIALARRVLAAGELAGGRLKRIGRGLPEVPARFAYYFVSRGEPDARGRSQASWLKAELAATSNSE